METRCLPLQDLSFDVGWTGRGTRGALYGRLPALAGLAALSLHMPKGSDIPTELSGLTGLRRLSMGFKGGEDAEYWHEGLSCTLLLGLRQLTYLGLAGCVTESLPAGVIGACLNSGCVLDVKKCRPASVNPCFKCPANVNGVTHKSANLAVMAKI
jgi:hypothetical protein